MPNVLLLEKDPFDVFEKKLQAEPFGGGDYNVRRPLYGVSQKDPKFAHISVYQDAGDSNPAQVVSLLDSSAPGGYSDATHNFIVQSVTESRQEKVQIIETFGDSFAFFYGDKPIILQVQGVLFNTPDFNWKNEFLANYELRLRGTKCVENRSRVFIGWDDVLAQGYLLNAQVNYDANSLAIVPFAFSMLLTKPPLDLSSANEPMEAPNPDAEDPWTYRSLGLDQQGTPESASLEAEIIAGASLRSDRFFPEYLTAIRKAPLVTLDPATGVARAEPGDPGDGVDVVGGGQKLAQEEALLALGASIARQQSGADRVEVALKIRSAPEQVPLTRREPTTLHSATSLLRGVSNCLGILDDTYGL